MFQPNSKLVGGQRFNGSGQKKFDPKPGTVAFYKANMPDRLNNTKIQIRQGTGFSDSDCEVIAARVLRWNESPLAFMKFDNPEGPNRKY